jgi:hypothetical protein
MLTKKSVFNQSRKDALKKDLKGFHQILDIQKLGYLADV